MFGAEVNPFNRWGKTPLDLLSVHQRFSFKTAATQLTDINSLHPKEDEMLRSSSPSLPPGGSDSPPSWSNSPSLERAGRLSDKMRTYKNKKGLFSRSREVRGEETFDKSGAQSYRKRSSTFVELFDRERDLLEAVIVSPEEAHLVHEEGICEDAVPPDYEKLSELMVSVGAYGERTYQQHLRETRCEVQFEPMLAPFPVLCMAKEAKLGYGEDDYFKCAPGEDSWVDSIPQVYKELDAHIRKRLADPSDTLAYSADEAFAFALQLRELTLLRKSGSRVLCLDGGGMKGLIQIEVLEQIERLTQRKITEIFDWIVGTSVGGIVALAIVYGKCRTGRKFDIRSRIDLTLCDLSAKKTPKELRQLMFQMKDEVFGSSRGGYANNTEALERILKEEFGNMTMEAVKYPRYCV